MQTATIHAAESGGVAKDLGAVGPGNLADFVIVDGDPLADIQDVWNVQTVFRNGIKYQIDQLLTGP